MGATLGLLTELIAVTSSLEAYVTFIHDVIEDTSRVLSSQARFGFGIVHPSTFLEIWQNLKPDGEWNTWETFRSDIEKSVAWTFLSLVSTRKAKLTVCAHNCVQLRNTVNKWDLTSIMESVDEIGGSLDLDTKDAKEAAGIESIVRQREEA
jgi:hypothetical protein